MNTSIITVIDKYLKHIKNDKHHRYSSWDNCFHKFSLSNPSEIHSLELAFYLASWGMYRGSSGLLQKNHLIHDGAVDIIFSNNGQKIKCSKETEVGRENIQDILSVKEELSKHYRNIKFRRGVGNDRFISPTDTLLSKVMLGTLGCVPAYDRYFISGLRELEMKYLEFNEASIFELLSFTDEHRIDITLAQQHIMAEVQKHYPYMKILDMYFWQIGYDSSFSK